MSLRSLFRSRAAGRETAARETRVADPIIDRLVAATDRRLAQVDGFRGKLRTPVLEARERLGAMIGAIPGPFEVSAQSWSAIPGLKPLFARAEDAPASWSNDAGVQRYFERHPQSDCLAMLGLLQTERRVLSSVQQGDIQVEVARTTVSYSQPQVLAPAGDEAAARNELALRALEYLAMRAMEEVGAIRAHKRELERERALLHAQLELARRRGRGLGGMATPAALDGPDARELERELTRTVGELEQLASRNLLPALLEALLAALSAPERHLGIEPCAVALDPMNFAVARSPESVTPCAAMLKLAGRGPFAVLIARFPRAALRPPENRLAEAARYL
jgi:hypothetical protein